MHVINNHNMTVAIQKALKCIPSVWPLQQFVATNPLWDCIDKPMSEVSSLFPEYANIQMTMTLDEYWEKYLSGQISRTALHQAISTAVCQNNIMGSTDNSIHIQLLFDFMTSSFNQNKLLKALQEHMYTIENKSSILFASQVQHLGYDNTLDLVTNECISWLNHYFCPTALYETILQKLEQNSPDSAADSLFAGWYKVMTIKNKAWKQFLCARPGNLYDFIDALVSELAIPKDALEKYMLAICWQLKGWIGYIKWQQNHLNSPYFNKTIDIAEIIAIWLANEAFQRVNSAKNIMSFVPNYAVEYQTQMNTPLQQVWLDYINEININLSEKGGEYIRLLTRNHDISVTSLCWIWQHAYELSYQEPLYQQLLEEKKTLTAQSQLQQDTSSSVVTTELPQSQWIFCIDVRSEIIRRHIERAGEHETFGFAGFFGFPHQLIDPNNKTITCQSPALIEPELSCEIPHKNRTVCDEAAQSMRNSIHTSKGMLLSAFALYEIVGFWFAFTLILKNYLLAFTHKIKTLCVGKKSPSQPTIAMPVFATDDNSFAVLVNAAKSLLNAIDLTNNFAEFVVVCSHGATTENNPYQAALHCGACGGNNGISNAVFACQVLNDIRIREQLSAENINIPNTTVFIPAHHDTTTDMIEWYYEEELLSVEQLDRLQRIKDDVINTTKLTVQERIKKLPGDNDVIKRSQHWAELIPEWGLANNSAMIIAPRCLTTQLNLDGRTFLHSYNTHTDPEGAVLESILLGPVVVAHWINAQYYFSSVDPHNFGSGSKLIHNIIKTVGVMEGNQSDLKYGLPEQSVFFKNKRIHEPRRLCVFIDATEDKINYLVEKHETLHNLVAGKWLTLRSLCVSVHSYQDRLKFR